jgi:predicted nuclease of restriction endonuclease-like (RecB) superfamily
MLDRIFRLVDEARHVSARTVNALMTATYWSIGRHIVEFEQQGKTRAEYGEQLLKRVATDLAARYGRGYSLTNLKQFRHFYLAWPALQKEKGQTLSDQLAVRDLSARFPLPWSAYVSLLSVKNEQARKFYETEALRGGWSVRQLDRQINSLFYERIALSRNKAKMLTKGAAAKTEDAVAPEGEIKDPYVLEFLGLKDEYSESDIEEALILHLERFLLELGGDFTFVGRQRRLRIGDEWYRIDLLFFHRKLRCLVVIDLKRGKFTHADAGQIYPMRYVLLHLRPTKCHRQKPIRRLHERSAASSRGTQRWASSFNSCPAPIGAGLLRGVSEPSGRHQTREISQERVGETLHQESPRRLSQGVNMYLNYAREHWTRADENPPVGLILCTQKDEAVARYALDGLPNKILATEYRTVLPDEQLIAAEIEKTRRQLEALRK